MTRLPYLEHPMQAVSILGSPAGLIPLIVVASLLLWHYRRRWALVLPLVMAGTGGLQLLSKWAGGSPSPESCRVGVPERSRPELGGVSRSARLPALELPTGPHVALGRLRGQRRTLLAVAFSRLYLDMHWFSDVCGGFALGLAYLLAIIWMVELMTHRRERQSGIVVSA